MWLINVKIGNENHYTVFGAFTPIGSNLIELPKRKEIANKFGFAEGNHTHKFTKDFVIENQNVKVEVLLLYGISTIDQAAEKMIGFYQKILQFKKEIRIKYPEIYPDLVRLEVWLTTHNL
jgi:hypothetical protein